MKALLTVQEASAYTGLAVSTLNKYRVRGGGPRFIRVGKRLIRYGVEDLDAYLTANTHASTSEYERPG